MTAPVTGATALYSFSDLQAEVGALASVMRDHGVGKGEPGDHLHADGARGDFRHVGVGPAGAPFTRWSFGGFAANELATRIDDAAPKLIISASCGIEPNRVIEYKPLLDEAIEISFQQARPLPCPAATNQNL